MADRENEKSSEDEKSDLEELKEKYESLKEKHSLPEFDKLNEDFQIEKVSEHESDYLIREVRKFVAEKAMNYLRFIEGVLNPVNGSMFVFSFIKTLTSDEKSILSDIYKKLAKREVQLIELDLVYSEESEAKYISEIFEEWQEIKRDFSKVLKKVQENWDVKTEKNGSSLVN